MERIYTFEETLCELDAMEKEQKDVLETSTSSSSSSGFASGEASDSSFNFNLVDDLEELPNGYTQKENRNERRMSETATTSKYKILEDEDDYIFENDESSSDESSDSNDEYLLSDEEEEPVKVEKKNVYIKDDFESVITLSNSSDIVLNKKIQQIKRTIDTLLSTSFSLEESFNIHSIYNFNFHCLQNRNRFLQEFIIILLFMEHIGICFTKHILSLVFPKMLVVPKKKNCERIRNYILSRFDFSNFDSSLDKKNTNQLSRKIEKYSAGVWFYIKNRIIIQKEETFTREDQLALANLLLKNKNSPFLSDPKLQSLNLWLSGLMKNIILYNMYNIYKHEGEKFVFNKKKTVEYQISVALRIVMSLMVESLNSTPETKYIKFFLYYRGDHLSAEEIVKNRLFQHIIKDIMSGFKKEETLKVFKKEFIEHIQSILSTDTSVE